MEVNVQLISSNFKGDERGERGFYEKGDKKLQKGRGYNKKVDAHFFYN